MTESLQPAYNTLVDLISSTNTTLLLLSLLALCTLAIRLINKADKRAMDKINNINKKIWSFK